MLGWKQVKPVFSNGCMVLINVDHIVCHKWKTLEQHILMHASHTSPHRLTADTLYKIRMGSSLCINHMSLILGIEKTVPPSQLVKNKDCRIHLVRVFFQSSSIL